VILLVLYHGSSRLFSNFEVREDLCVHDINSVLSEGMGIYLTSDKRIASNYGNIIYEVEVYDRNILDLTNIKGVSFVIQRLCEGLGEIGVDVRDYLREETLDRIIDGVVSGGLCCTKIDRELEMYLDSEESFHIDGNVVEEVYERLGNINREDILDRYVIKFNDRGLGVVYIAKNPLLLKIREIIR
jgi:hypothetical protein